MKNQLCPQTRKHKSERERLLPIIERLYVPSGDAGEANLTSQHQKAQSDFSWKTEKHGKNLEFSMENLLCPQTQKHKSKRKRLLPIIERLYVPSGNAGEANLTSQHQKAICRKTGEKLGAFPGG